jgi:hypothetical protein
MSCALAPLAGLRSPPESGGSRPPCSGAIMKQLFCQHAIHGETAATGDEDRQGAAHDRDILQKVIVLADLLRAGRVFPITVCERGSDQQSAIGTGTRTTLSLPRMAPTTPSSV